MEKAKNEGKKRRNIKDENNTKTQKRKNTNVIIPRVEPLKLKTCSSSFYISSRLFIIIINSYSWSPLSDNDEPWNSLEINSSSESIVCPYKSAQIRSKFWIEHVVCEVYGGVAGRTRTYRGGIQGGDYVRGVLREGAGPGMASGRNRGGLGRSIWWGLGWGRLVRVDVADMSKPIRISPFPPYVDLVCSVPENSDIWGKFGWRRRRLGCIFSIPTISGLSRRTNVNGLRTVLRDLLTSFVIHKRQQTQAYSRRKLAYKN